MGKPSVLTVRIPTELKERVSERASEQGVSLNQYVMYVLTDAVAKNETEQFFRRVVGDRTKDEVRANFERVLQKIGDRMPLTGDELPEIEEQTEAKLSAAAD